IVGVEKRIHHRDVLGNTESRPWIEAQPGIPNDLRHVRHGDQQRRLEIWHDRGHLSYLARTARFRPDHPDAAASIGRGSLFSSEYPTSCHFIIHANATTKAKAPIDPTSAWPMRIQRLRTSWMGWIVSVGID